MIFCLSRELSSPSSMPINKLSWEIWRREEKQIQSNAEKNRQKLRQESQFKHETELAPIWYKVDRFKCPVWVALLSIQSH